MKHHLLFCLLAVFAAVSCTKEPIESPETPQSESAETNSLFTSEITVKFTEDMAAQVEDDFAAGKLYTKSAHFNELVDELGITSIRRVFGEDERFIERERKAGLHLWYRITVDPDKVVMTKAAGDLASIPGVELAEPVRKIKSTAFNDSYYSNQWAFNNSGFNINIEEVWNNYTTGSEDVIVAVLDQGVQLDHPDIPSVIGEGYAGGSRTFISGASAINPGNHGTHVAGIIAASSNNGRGVSGVAGGDAQTGSPAVRILGCQILDEDPVVANDAEAFRYAANNGAVIAQNSWGYNFDKNGDGRLDASEIDSASRTEINSDLKAAVDYFIKYAGCDNSGNQLPDSPMKGGVVILAAGNDNIPYGAPANYDKVIAVGAVDRYGHRSSFSNYGDWVDICAPGSDIYSCVLDGYASMDGTSMACPYVSGVAALLVSYYGGPGFTNEMLKERLLEGANSEISPSTPAQNIGPMLDAYGSFTYGGTTPPDRVREYETEAFGGVINFSWAVTADEDNGKAEGYLLLATTDRNELEDIDLRDIPESVRWSQVVVGDKAVGDELNGSIEGLEFSTTYYVAIAGYDYQQNYSSLSDIREVTTTGNNPPVISSSETGEIVLKSHETFTRSYIIKDPDAQEITVEFSPGSDAASLPEGSGADEYVFTVVGNLADPGEYTAVVKVTDTQDASATENIKYRILENHAPVTVAEIRDVMLQAMGQSSEVAMSELVADEDGELLTWSISNTAPTTVHASISSNTLYLTALSYGNAQVTITGTDCRGEKASATVNVIVKNPDSPLEVYPNPVSDYLSVRTMEEMDTRVMITTSTGATVYDETAPVSVFNPAVIDMRNCAPGQYRVYVSFGGNEYTRTVVKL